MDYKNLFEEFNEGGKLLLPDVTVTFDAISWSKHPAFEGVKLKAIIQSLANFFFRGYCVGIMMGTTVNQWK